VIKKQLNKNKKEVKEFLVGGCWVDMVFNQHLATSS
jgi:hypothetical protein